MQKIAFSELGLSPEILKAISKMGFEQASPIQTLAIPVLLQGRDLVGQSQTGTGKTAAFAIPAVEMASADLRHPQTLILCPTRELALQIAEETAKIAAFKKGLRELPIYGGSGYERQFRALREGAQIIIGTPGRIIDHIERGSLQLGKIKTVILDEADRMLDMGFIDDIRTILSRLPAPRQTVLFSATMPRSLKDIIQSFTKHPEHIHIRAESLTVPQIQQTYYDVSQHSKLDVLCRTIDTEEINYAIIFCTTKKTVDELTEHLTARGYAADKIHGDLSQAMRERVISRFKAKKIDFLVATDVAARGLDVDDVAVVCNYDLPHDAEDYVHRIGRTGRAGKSGMAISLVAGRDIYKLQYIQKHTRSQITRKTLPTSEQVEQRRADKLYKSITSSLDSSHFTPQEAILERLLQRGHTPSEIISCLIGLLQKHTPKYSPATDSITKADAAFHDQDTHWKNTAPKNRKFRKKTHPAERRIKKRQNSQTP